MKKNYLFTPGPTMVPPQVLSELAKPVVHHRAPEFTPIFESVCKDLKYLFQTEQPVMTINSSGTGSMEAAVANLLSAGDEVIAIVGGKFGERWADICKVYKVNVHVVDVEWGEGYCAKDLEKLLSEKPNTKAVFTTLCETCTGVTYDVKGFAEVTGKTEAILVVDGVSGLGADELRMDEWKVDVVVTSSQKALMCPPGLSFIALSEKAWKMTETSTLPKYYFDLKKHKKSIAKFQTPYTSGVTLLAGAKKALQMIREEGIENVWSRHQRLADALRAGIGAIGLEPFAQVPSNTVVSVKAPEGISGNDIKKLMSSKFGFSIAGGQAQLSGKIFRIAALGYACDSDVIMIIGALEVVLKELGHKFELGTGVQAALQVLGG